MTDFKDINIPKTDEKKRVASEEIKGQLWVYDQRDGYITEREKKARERKADKGDAIHITNDEELVTHT